MSLRKVYIYERSGREASAFCLIGMSPLPEHSIVGDVDAAVLDADRAAALQLFERPGDDFTHGSQLRCELLLCPVAGATLQPETR